MKEVVCQVVDDVAEDTTTVCEHSRMPIVEENKVSEAVEWSSENDEKRGWHDQAVSVHWEIMMNAVHQKVKHQKDAVIRKVAFAIVSAYQSIFTKEKTTYSSMWNKNLCILYSINDHRE